jgi:transcriptional regulator with XRE-family HTH domain
MQGLADKVGCSHTNISNWEKGHYRIPAKRYTALGKALGVSASYLFGSGSAALLASSDMVMALGMILDSFDTRDDSKTVRIKSSPGADAWRAIHLCRSLYEAIEREDVELEEAIGEWIEELPHPDQPNC